jgi:hypothetical protein
MKILGHLDRFGPPVGGGVITTVAILQELAQRGHDVYLVSNRAPLPNLPHVTCCKAATPETMLNLYQAADLVVPHMTATPVAMEFIRATSTPLMYPVHDDGQLELYGLGPKDVTLVLFFANGLRERTGWPGEQFVVHPPTWSWEHQVDQTGDAVTIPSLSPEKGGETFWKLVERLPNRRFIGVVGGWGNQIIPDPVPDNVEIMTHQGNNLQEVFRKTRILLVPSQRLNESERYWTENWGRAAVEAAASGIPVIANPAPGPVEALGEAGIFCDRNDIDAWIDAIRALDDPITYERYSTLSFRRAKALDAIVKRQLDELDARLSQLVPAKRQERALPLD